MVGVFTIRFLISLNSFVDLFFLAFNFLDNSLFDDNNELYANITRLKFKISFHSPLLSNSKVINTMKRLSKESEDFEKLLENYISETDKERNKKKEYIEKITNSLIFEDKKIEKFFKQIELVLKNYIKKKIEK